MEITLKAKSTDSTPDGMGYATYKVNVVSETWEGWWGTTSAMDACGAGAILFPRLSWEPYTETLSTIQKAALAMMRERGTGAVYIGEPRKGRYVWPEDVRQSEQVACDVVNHYQKKESAHFVR